MGDLIRNASIAVGTSAVLVAPPLIEGQRVVLVLTNTSTAGQTITIQTGSEAIAGAGIILYPAGSWSEAIDASFIPSNLAFWAVASGASGTLAIQERVRRV
jgi:hypothetical protein